MPVHEDVLKSVSGLFSALSHPVRVKILGLLHKEEMDVTHLQQSLEISQSSVSQHLQLLKHHGLVAERREGKHIFYRLKHKQVSQVVVSAFQLISMDIATNSDALSNYMDLLSIWNL